MVPRIFAKPVVQVLPPVVSTDAPAARPEGDIGHPR